MHWGAIAFLLGILLFFSLSTPSDPVFIQFLPVLLFMALVRPALRIPMLFVCGVLWASFRTELVLLERLPSALQGRDLTMEVTVASIPKHTDVKTQFIAKVEHTNLPKDANWTSGQVRLSWYGSAPHLVPGDRWQLTVRLKQPHGFLNPGGFDYERWLFQQGIDAIGYVRANADNRKLETDATHLVTRIRFWLADAIGQALGGSTYTGLVKALVIGERADISEPQWAVLRATGTGHLIAISGLHIGLVAGLAFFVAKRAWALGPSLTLILPAPRLAALMALLAAATYALLAGFSIPTRRALVMVCVIMLGIFFQRNMVPSVSLGWALLLVLLLDPFSVLATGFWLSFAAVGIILLGMTGHLKVRGLLHQWGRVQMLVTIGLMPLTLYAFQQQPLVAPLANLMAVPWMGFVAVPTCLTGSALLLPFPDAGAPLLSLGAQAIGLMWILLDQLATWVPTLQSPQQPPLWALLAAGVGVVLLLLPRGTPARWLGVIWLLPLFWLPPPRPERGEIWLTLLDVGQGLSVAVQTQKHFLVYDTGPRYSATFDAGRAVVLPFMHHQGIHSVDMLILSHEDIDHMGGAESLRAEVPVEQILGNVTDPLARLTRCERGQHWHWDGVEFAILHPLPDTHTGRNNESCVLRITGPAGTILLTGDIEQEAEFQLGRFYSESLQADILVVPHHGSQTSSTQAFVTAVAPQSALFAVGYRNRFGLPHRAVVARYQRLGAAIYNTAQHGAITFVLKPGAAISEPQLHRLERGRVWHHDASASD